MLFRQRSFLGRAVRFQAGFTLIELMITLSIVAFLGMLAAGELARRSEEEIGRAHV